MFDVFNIYGYGDPKPLAVLPGAADWREARKTASQYAKEHPQKKGYLEIPDTTRERGAFFYEVSDGKAHSSAASWCRPKFFAAQAKYVAQAARDRKRLKKKGQPCPLCGRR